MGIRQRKPWVHGANAESQVVLSLCLVQRTVRCPSMKTMSLGPCKRLEPISNNSTQRQDATRTRSPAFNLPRKLQSLPSFDGASSAHLVLGVDCATLNIVERSPEGLSQERFRSYAFKTGPTTPGRRRMDASAVPMLKLKVLHRILQRPGRTRQESSWTSHGLREQVISCSLSVGLFQLVTTADVVPWSANCQNTTREAIF